jgi:hypothetical protein
MDTLLENNLINLYLPGQAHHTTYIDTDEFFDDEFFDCEEEICDNPSIKLCISSPWDSFPKKSDRKKASWKHPYWKSDEIYKRMRSYHNLSSFCLQPIPLLPYPEQETYKLTELQLDPKKSIEVYENPGDGLIEINIPFQLDDNGILKTIYVRKETDNKHPDDVKWGLYKGQKNRESDEYPRKFLLQSGSVKKYLGWKLIKTFWTKEIESVSNTPMI